MGFSAWKDLWENSAKIPGQKKIRKNSRDIHKLNKMVKKKIIKAGKIFGKEFDPMSFLIATHGFGSKGN